MCKRVAHSTVKALAGKFPVIAIMGPRQAGKTTLAKSVFAEHQYVNLEALDAREFATEDPRGFLEQYGQSGVILDEVQNVPTLFSYIQTYADEANQSGKYILSGSQNFLMMENITQSLAGRVAIVKLLPLSQMELSVEGLLADTLDAVIFQGGYPRLYQHDMQPQEWFPSYIQTYLERDVRKLKQIHDLNLFQKFLRLCAGHVGQVVNLNSLASDCGITHNTAKSWLGLLEASFIAYTLQPYYRNYNKRVIKSPKLYFYDTGLACALLNLSDASQLTNYYMRGALFENYVISELMKTRLNRGLTPNFYYWRDRQGHEIDCLVERGDAVIPIEIKSGKTINSDYFRNINYWREEISAIEKSYILYAGDSEQDRQRTQLLNWRALSDSSNSLLALLD